MKSIATVFSFVFLLNVMSFAQGQGQDIKNPNVKMGQKALYDGKFKEAVAHLEKAMPAESKNADVLYMLGYAYFHTPDYSKAVEAFGDVIALRPNNVSAYYYRAKARNAQGTQLNISNGDREKLLQASIADYSKAIELNKEDLKLYQNRAIAYRDYGILKGTKIPKFFDKGIAETAFKSSIADFQHVLDANPNRKDIATEIKKANVYMENIGR